MKKKQYKTGESQRRAARAYQERTNQKRIGLTMPEAEYNASRATMAAHGLTPIGVWRFAMVKLNAEPLPELSDMQKPD